MGTAFCGSPGLPGPRTGRKTNRMKRLVIGITAHVDSGKTTLSEAMLYRAGALRKLGQGLGY